MRVCLLFICYLFLCATPSLLQAQESDDFYLVDGLETISITKADSLLLDSCLSNYHKTRSDSEKIQWIEIIAEESWDERIWPKYNQFMYDLADKNLQKDANNTYFLKFKARAINNFGYLNSAKGRYLKALDNYSQSLSIQKQIHDTAGISSGYSNLGVVYEKLGDLNKATEYYNIALNYKKQMNDSSGMAVLYSNLGELSESMGDHESALKYFHKALNIRLKLENKYRIVQSLHHMGQHYRMLHKNKVAESYLYRSLNIAEKIQYTRYVGLANLELGILNMEYQPVLAQKHLNKSLSISNRLNNISDRLTGHFELARFHNTHGNFELALQHARQAFEDAGELGSQLKIKNTADYLSGLYTQKKDYEKALKYYKISVKAGNNIKDTEIKNRITRQKLESEFEQKKNQITLEKEKKVAIEREKAKNQKIITYVIIGVLVLMLLFLLFILNRYRITQKQKRVISKQRAELEVKNNLVFDSIRYAKHIINAVIPSQDTSSMGFSEAFVLFKPKDIVSGDFLWSYQIDSDQVITIVADCTGHGVPGAMLSMVCSDILDFIIRKNGEHDPAVILEKFNLELIYKLNKENVQRDDIKDGVEMSICYYDNKTQTAKYAGSGQRIYHVYDKKTDQYSGDRIPLGNPKYSLGKQFKSHDIKLAKGDTIYMFTDGYPDQKGGERGKKFYYQTLKNLLVDHSDRPMPEQRQILLDTFEAFRGDIEQYDDILVVGLRC